MSAFSVASSRISGSSAGSTPRSAASAQSRASRSSPLRGSASSRSSLWDVGCRCSTSRPGPATSSPTASSATTASPAAPTPISTSTPGRDFEREIVVKVNVPELLRAELARPSWRRELVALGTNTDPYQWVESRYRMMPEILAALEEAETPVSVLTKSPLVMRDVELYERMAKRLPVSVNLSVPTLDEKAWRATEPHTPSPEARLDAVAELRRRGIDSGVLIAPLMPGINDSPEQVAADRRPRPRGRRHLPRRRRPAPPRRGQRRLLRLARGETPRPDPRNTSSSTPTAPTCARRSANAPPAPSAAGAAPAVREAGGDQAQQAGATPRPPGDRPRRAIRRSGISYPPGGSVLRLWTER